MRPYLSPIPFAKVPAPLDVLRYLPQHHISKQARFTGRYALVPQIDLSDYSCRAVIDWVRIRVGLSRQTQHRWLQSTIKPYVDRTQMIRPIGLISGTASDQFEITFQEPRLWKVSDALAAIEAAYGFVYPAQCDAIEVSVDFTPRMPSALSRRLMFRTLTNHLRPKIDLFADAAAQPRFSWGGKDETFIMIPSSKLIKADEFFYAVNEFDCPAACDATFYVGAKEGPVSWRIMDKIIDRQNRSTGTFIALPEQRRRVRIEVTLQGSEIDSLGIRFVSDLLRFDFATLKTRCFSFKLPTFSDGLQPTGSSIVGQEVEDRRIAKFLKTGIIGLSLMDAARARFRDKNRKDFVGFFKKRRLRTPRKMQPGQLGPMLAYSEVDRRVEMALRKLTIREK